MFNDVARPIVVIMHSTCIKNTNELVGVVNIDRDVCEPVQLKQFHKHITSLLENLPRLVVTGCMLVRVILGPEPEQQNISSSA